MLRGSPQPAFNRMRGMTTLMIGIEDEKVDQAIQIVEDQCIPASDFNQHSATVFVLYDNHFLQVKPILNPIS